jgi:hypothetical protein
MIINLDTKPKVDISFLDEESMAFLSDQMMIPDFTAKRGERPYLDYIVNRSVTAITEPEAEMLYSFVTSDAAKADARHTVRYCLEAVLRGILEKFAHKRCYLQWPDNGQLADGEAIETTLHSIVAGIRFALSNTDKDIPYNGLDHGRASSGDLSPIDSLTAENIRYQIEEQGETERDALFELVRIAYKVGLEQGRRHRFQEEQKSWNQTEPLIKAALKPLRTFD